MDLKNEDNLKNENNLKNEDNLKNENDLKNKDGLKIVPPPQFFFVHLLNPSSEGGASKAPPSINGDCS